MIVAFVKKSLPDYIIQNDSYKDINGKGFVERYLEIFGLELDEDLVPYIEDLVIQKNPILADIKFLDNLAIMMGDTPDFSQDTAHYRNIISFIVAIYRIKGTKKSYQSILYGLGLFNTAILEIPLISIEYDDVLVEYDAVEEFEYDISCLTCSDYNISTEGLAVMTAELYNQILSLVELVEPINAKLGSIIYNTIEIIPVFISVTIDGNGDLVYENAADPGLILTLDSNGDLIISGPQAAQYFINANGDLIYIPL